ncbi:MAG: hypothetical protein WBC04_18430 [Candidatus Acidiferrales bacterium]
MISDKVFHITPAILDRALARSRDYASSVSEHIDGAFILSRMAKEFPWLEEASVLVVNEADKQNLADVLQIICRIGIVYGLYVADELERVRVQ